MERLHLLIRTAALPPANIGTRRPTATPHSPIIPSYCHLLTDASLALLVGLTRLEHLDVSYLPKITDSVSEGSYGLHVLYL